MKSAIGILICLVLQLVYPLCAQPQLANHFKKKLVLNLPVNWQGPSILVENGQLFRLGQNDESSPLANASRPAFFHYNFFRAADQAELWFDSSGRKLFSVDQGGNVYGPYERPKGDVVFLKGKMCVVRDGAKAILYPDLADLSSRQEVSIEVNSRFFSDGFFFVVKDFDEIKVGRFGRDSLVFSKSIPPQERFYSFFPRFSASGLVLSIMSGNIFDEYLSIDTSGVKSQFRFRAFSRNFLRAQGDSVYFLNADTRLSLPPGGR